MIRKISSTTILSIILALMLTGCASIIKPGNRDTIWRSRSSGLDRNRVSGDGIVWHWPWRNVIEYDVQWKSYRQDVALLTADDLHITATVSILI